MLVVRAQPPRDLRRPGSLRRATCLLVAALAVAASPAAAQRVRGTVRQNGGVIPVPGALVVARDEVGHEQARTTADSAGRFDLALPGPGSYRVGALRIGFRLAPEALVTAAEGQTVSADLEVGGQIAALATVEVRGQSSCSGDRTAAARAMDYWERARVALASVDPLSGSGRAHATVVTFDEVLDTADIAQSVYSATQSGETRRPFASVAPDSIVATGFVRTVGRSVEYYAPDAEVLLSSSFASSHCFQAEPAPPSRPGLVGIHITPQHAGGRADVIGDLWLDAATSRLTSLAFGYAGIPESSRRAGAGGEVRFAYLPSGRAVVSRWWIRMPQTWIERTLDGVGIYQRVIDHEHVSSIRVTGGELESVVEDADTVFRASGHVFVASMRRGDSTAGGVLFELLGTPHEARTDRRGRAVMHGITPGTYRLRVNFADDQRAPQDLVMMARGDADTTLLSMAIPPPRAVSASAGAGAIAGRVTRSLDSLPLGDALVTVDGTDLSARTGRDGTFRIDGLAPGEHAVRVARIGYHPSVVPEVVIADSVRTSDIRMVGLPGWLNAVVISGKRRDIPPGLEDVYRRGLSGLGTFFTRDDIERVHAYDIKSLITTIPGVTANDRGIQFARCRMGENGPGPKPSNDGTQTIRPSNPDKIQVYVDGVKVTRDPPPGETYYTSAFSPYEALKLVNVDAIQAVEIYRGVAEIPAEFLNDACAVIAIWTRAY